MINWYNLPRAIKSNLILDAEEFPCIDVEMFNKIVSKTEWGNITVSLKVLFLLLGASTRVSWYGLPQKVEELILAVQIFECE